MNPLVRVIPAGLVKLFAKPYVAGDSLSLALDEAAALAADEDTATTLDLLAEDVESDDQVRDNLATYERVIDAVATDGRFDAGLRPTVSLKLSSFTTAPLDRGGDGAGAREAVTALVERAARLGVAMTLDMESRAWTDFTLDLVRDLHAAGHRHLGAVIQSRLHRSGADLDRLPPGCRVRLVIGIYDEPADVALTDKTAMKERLLELAATLLARGHVVELATHDERFVRRFLDEVVPAAGVGPERYELQFLYGVPRDGLRAELRGRGVRTRLYVPFARSWPQAIAYLRRRLDEYPAMSMLVLRNLLADAWGRVVPGGR